MAKNFCCPNCGSHDVYSTFESENVKKSEPIFVHWHCNECKSTFNSPQDIACAISDIQRESKKSFKSTVYVCAAAIAFSVCLLLSILLKDTIVGIIFAAGLICAAVIGIIVSAVKRQSINRAAAKLERELEDVTLKMESYRVN